MKPVLRLVTALTAVALASGAARAQAPEVRKVDLPNWWAGHSVNPVRLLIHGRNLAGARMECPRLACGEVKVNAAGTYAFVDVTVDGGVAPGQYPLTLRTGGGTARVPFTVSPPLPATGRFQGFGPDDVIYLLMPDRFANGDPATTSPPSRAASSTAATCAAGTGATWRGCARSCPTCATWGSPPSG